MTAIQPIRFARSEVVRTIAFLASSDWLDGDMGQLYRIALDWLAVLVIDRQAL